MTLGKNIKKQTLIPEQNDAQLNKGGKKTSKSSQKGRSDKTQAIKDDQVARTQMRNRFEEELADMRSKKLNLITMRLGNGTYGFEIDCVQEVVMTPKLMQIPNTPDYVIGLGKVRGQTLMILDLERKFHLESKLDQSNSYTIIVESDNFIVGLVTNDMPATHRVEGSKLESVEGNYAEQSLDVSYVKGLIQIEGNVVFLMDINTMVESNEVSSIVEGL